MKLPKNILVLMLIALTLGGFVYLSEIQSKTKKETIQKNKEKIFTFAEEEIVGLKIEKQNETLVFEKTGNELNPWQMKKPQEKNASDAAISYLLNLLANGEIDKNFNISTDKEKIYGLDQPFAKITITLTNKKTHQIILGKPSFNDEFIYSQIDNFNEQVSLVKIDFKYAIDRKIEEWEQGENNSN